MEKCEECSSVATYICVCVENSLCEECLIEHITSDKTLKHRTVSLSHPLLSFLLESGDQDEDPDDYLLNTATQIKALEEFRDKCINLIDSKLQSLQEAELLEVPKQSKHLDFNTALTPIPKQNPNHSSYISFKGDLDVKDIKFQNSPRKHNESQLAQNYSSRMLSKRDIDVRTSYYLSSPRKFNDTHISPGSIYRSSEKTPERGEHYTYKVLICGGIKVGKTCIIQSFKHIHEANYDASSLMFHSIRYENLKVNLEVNESKGIEGSKNSLGALVVFDLTKRDSLREAEELIELLENNSPVLSVVILVGTRLDVVVSNPGKRVSSFAAIQNYAINKGVFYDEISAINYSHVEELFMRLVRELLKKSNS